MNGLDHNACFRAMPFKNLIVCVHAHTYMTYHKPLFIGHNLANRRITGGVQQLLIPELTQFNFTWSG